MNSVVIFKEERKKIKERKIFILSVKSDRLNMDPIQHYGRQNIWTQVTPRILINYS